MSHAIERAKERYGVQLSEADLVWARDQISSRSAFVFFLRPKHGGLSEWAVWLEGTWVALVMSPSGTFVTATPPGDLRCVRKPLEARAIQIRKILSAQASQPQ